MKTSLVVASVLLAGVALEVAAFRINNNNGNYNNYNNEQQQQLNNNEKWSLFGHGDSSSGSSNFDSMTFEQMIEQTESNNGLNKFLNSDNFESRLAGHQNQNAQSEEFDNGSSAEQNERRQYQNQNQAFANQPAGLAKKMVDKIAALQNIVLNQNIARHANHLNGALDINRNVIKMSEHDFVTFYNNTLKNLNNGDLTYMYVNPEKDVVYFQYQFNEIEAAGSFKSNHRDAKQGYYTVLLNQVNSNVSTGFENIQHAVIRPANFRYAEASVRTENGVETQAFNDAFERRFLRVLNDAVTDEVFRSTNGEMAAQIKNEIRKPIIAFHGAENKGKLFDMRWKENDVAIEMSNIGYQSSERAAQQSTINSMSFVRKSENSCKMRYTFTLKGLEWTSPLTVMSAGNRMTARPVNVGIDRVNIQVTVNKSLDQQQSKFYTNVEAKGVRYNFDNSAQSELIAIVENNFKRYFEHSLALYFQEQLEKLTSQNGSY